MKRRIVYAATILIGLVLIFNLVRTLSQTYRSGQRVATLAQEVEELKIEEEQLGQQLKYRQSEEFVEQQARDKLALIKPGETVVVFDDKSQILSTKSQKEENRSEQPNYQQWWGLFFE